MGAQNISVFLCLQRNRHLPLTMRSLLFFSTLFFFFHSSTSDFASKLATFINETPDGYTVSPEVRNGQNCHCRQPTVATTIATTILPVSSVSTVFTTTTPAPAPTTATYPAPATTATYPAPTTTVTVAAAAPATTYPTLTMGSSAAV